MGFFDKIKDIISSKIGDVPTIKATMLGPRAVGKTSVMASIFSDSRDEIAGTKLYFRPQKDTASVLISKKLWPTSQILELLKQAIPLLLLTSRWVYWEEINL